MGAGAQILSKEIGVGIKRTISQSETIQFLDTRISQAAQLVDALSELKGAAMKAGQLLSLELSDLLPPEVTEVLRQLHDKATFLPYSEIESILKRELGDTQFNRLTDISETPIAAASIGQVHRAHFDGQDIVLKIQYPGVADSIDADLAILKRLIQGFLKVSGKQIITDELFAEISESLHEEMDYIKEANALEAYRSLIKSESGFAVPDVIHELTSARVLALTYMNGDRLSDWLKKDHDETDLQIFADRILSLLFIEFFKIGFVQTDPNYGNFLIQSEDHTLILLDFGAAKQYSAEFRKDFRLLLEAVYERSHDEIFRLAAKFSLIDPRESPDVKAIFLQLMELIVDIFRPEYQPFDFADDTYLHDIRTMAMTLVGQAKYTGPARKLLFLNRKLGGMFHLLKDAGIARDLHPYWQAMLRMV